MEHKARSLISAMGVFLGLLFPLRFPAIFWPILISAAVLAAALTFWVFGEVPNLTRIKEDWFTITFISFFVLSMGTFAYLVPNPIIQALLLGGTGMFVYFSYIVANRLKRNYLPSLFLRNISFFTAILGVFFATASILRWFSTGSLAYGSALTIGLTFISVFFISEYLFEVQGFEKSILYSLAIAFSFSQIVWISSYWMINYPGNNKILTTGVPFPAIYGTIFFYLFWGLSHHRIENNLSRRVVWEYLLISGLFILILFSTASWLP